MNCNSEKLSGHQVLNDENNNSVIQKLEPCHTYYLGVPRAFKRVMAVGT
jgi:hypothetical protein